jgi:hypothetical protein
MSAPWTRDTARPLPPNITSPAKLRSAQELVNAFDRDLLWTEQRNLWKQNRKHFSIADCGFAEMT